MKVFATLAVAAVSALAGTAHSAGREQVLSSALRAVHARSGSARLADGGRGVVIAGASQEAEWKGYVAASVYAAHGWPLRWVRFVRRSHPPGASVTLGFPAVNCACAYPGMQRLAKVRAASRRQVARVIETAAKRVGAHVDRIDFLHPLAFAPLIVITARHPRNFLRLGKATWLVGKLQGRIEGAFIVVRDTEGRTVASGGYTGRSYTAYGEVGWAIPD